MSFHVYIANPGFKDDPIELDHWVAAAKKVASKRDNFVIREKSGRNNSTWMAAHLAGSKRQWLKLNPYGLIHAQDPSKELMEIMFDVAESLDLKVYSERGKPYKDISDWEKRTKQFQQQRDKKRQAAKRKINRKRIFWLAVIVTSLLVGIFS